MGTSSASCGSRPRGTSGSTAPHEYSEPLDGSESSPTLFRGFLFHYGALLGGRLLGDDVAWERAIRGAKGLMTAYNPAAGVVPLGTATEEAHSVGDSETSIDAVGAVVACSPRWPSGPGTRR